MLPVQQLVELTDADHGPDIYHYITSDLLYPYYACSIPALLSQPTQHKICVREGYDTHMCGRALPYMLRYSIVLNLSEPFLR